MSSLTLIGQVSVAYLKDQLSSDDTDGTGRFQIDCLTSDQTAAIARAVLNDRSLASLIDVKLPLHFMEGQDLPESVLTTRRATYYRNASCPKSAWLIANVGDDEEASLKEFTPLGSPQLLSQTKLWVEAASEGLPLTPEHKKWWEKALSGLRDLKFVSLDRFARYVLTTRQAIEMEGETIISALGSSLPELRLPRETNYFNTLNEKLRGHASRWKALYDSSSKKKACFLLKLTPAQLLLSEDDLTRAYNKVKESIPEVNHERVLKFMESPSGWNDAAARLAECEWEGISPLFDGLRREQFNLGQATLDFYDERESEDIELVSSDEKDYLRRLILRKTTHPEEEDERFYDSHRNELKADRKLKSAWDRFVFGKPKETDDFLIGLALCFESLFSQVAPGSKRKLKIRCDRTSKKDLKEINVDAGLYFVNRYRGLKSLLGPRVSWEVGHLLDFEDLVEEWKGKPKYSPNRSTAKGALQLKFVIELEVSLLTGGTETYFSQLLWKFNPNQVTSEMFEDWSRLKEHPIVFCRALRETTSGKGQLQTLDLGNVKTFVPAYGQDRGSFVSVYKRANNIALAWIDNLEQARDRGLISGDVATKLREHFQAFQEGYSAAISGFSTRGLAHDDLTSQLTLYSQLLDTICAEAKGDGNRELLLKPLLHIGAVSIEGGRPAVITAPWHPLRLAAMKQKALLLSGLIKYLLKSENIQFGDTRLFFKELEEELKHPFYPELALGWYGNSPELLTLTDTVGDYTLHEPSVRGGDDADVTNENPTEAANKVLELVRRYLALYPHEQANLSVVLYNSDSARLPLAVVDKISTMHEDEEDARCQIVLRHRDGKRLRSLYERIVESSGDDADAFNPSEATKDFMARLRIGIMADQAAIPDPKDGFPADIVFSQDVIARHAKLEWYPESAKPIALDNLVPSRWSRRRPAARDDMKSIVYLCCPVQSKEGWSYITAITSFFKGDWDGSTERRLLPVRQLNFQDNNTAQIFEETHNLGNWVVNFDELLDRRQLLNQSVKVIRYKQSATQGRNVVISSKAPLGLLRSMVLRRIRDLSLDLGGEAGYVELAERFIQDANEVSGDIVLRAAKRGKNASELMGVVLSKYLIRNELGASRLYGWYFLDDYADWLGQKEEQIADILVLSPEIAEDGRLRLAMVVSEAKYIDASGLVAKRKESQKQLRDTVKRINEAIFGNPERLDRDLWLARLSDLILDGVQVPAQSAVNLSDWRRAIRDGNCDIYVRGYSHVFVSGPADAKDSSSFSVVAELENAYQEVYSREHVRQLVLNYHKNQDPMTLRKEVAEENVWDYRKYVRPSDRIETLVQRDQLASDRMQEGRGPGDRRTQTEPKDLATELGAKVPAGNNLNKSPTVPAPDTSGTPPPPTLQQESIGHWAYPKISQLLEVGNDYSAGGERENLWLKEVENKAKGALQQFQLNSKLVHSVLTPNSALLKFAGSSNLTVEQVLRRRSEFLTTHQLNIISVQPEPGLVAIAIERPQRQVIKTKELWRSWRPNASGGNQELLIGVREDDGRPLLLSPAKEHAPHTLIAGSTGSGKSILMQNIILGIAATNQPDQAKIVLIDPKLGVDYFQYDSLPHLDGGVIDDQEMALSKINSLIGEMEDRYRKFRDARAQPLHVYNQRVPEAERLPVIWLIHDEFAEWMMVEDYKQAVTSAVGRLGVKARAAGIHLVFAAQRPDANVMPLQLRANLGNRLILRVDSEGTSEIALGEKGAERLLGKGHLLAKLEGAASLTYAQVPMIDEEFSESVVAQITTGERARTKHS